MWDLWKDRMSFAIDIFVLMVIVWVFVAGVMVTARYFMPKRTIECTILQTTK